MGKKIFLQRKQFEMKLRIVELEQENDHLRETLVRTLELLKQKDEQLSEARKSLVSLDLTLNELREELNEKESLQQLMYFEMFQKGRDSATFEFAEQEAKIATKSKVIRAKSESIDQDRDLLKQLTKTKFELDQLKRYQKCAGEATKSVDLYYQFAKETLYHYLVSPSNHLKLQHLNTLVDLFQYDESKLVKINESLKQTNHHQHHHQNQTSGI